MSTASRWCRDPNDGINSLFGTTHIFTRHSLERLGGVSEAAFGEENYREVNLRYGAETDNGSWRLGPLGREFESFDTDKTPRDGAPVFDRRAYVSLKYAFR